MSLLLYERFMDTVWINYNTSVQDEFLQCCEAAGALAIPEFKRYAPPASAAEDDNTDFL